MQVVSAGAPRGGSRGSGRAREARGRSGQPARSPPPASAAGPRRRPVSPRAWRRSRRRTVGWRTHNRASDGRLHRQEVSAVPLPATPPSHAEPVALAPDGATQSRPSANQEDAQDQSAPEPQRLRSRPTRRRPSRSSASPRPPRPRSRLPRRRRAPRVTVAMRRPRGRSSPMSLVRAGASGGIGSRGRVGWAVVIAVTALLTGASVTRAAGGTYLAVQCHDFSRGISDAELFSEGGYEASSLCSDPGSAAPARKRGPGVMAAPRPACRSRPPAGSEIAAFSLAFDGRTSDGHYAQVAVIQGGGANLLHRAGNNPGWLCDDEPRWPRRLSSDRRSWLAQNNPPCGQSSAAHVWVAQRRRGAQRLVRPSLSARRRQPA